MKECECRICRKSLSVQNIVSLCHVFLVSININDQRWVTNNNNSLFFDQLHRSQVISHPVCGRAPSARDSSEETSNTAASTPGSGPRPLSTSRLQPRTPCTQTRARVRAQRSRAARPTPLERSQVRHADCLSRLQRQDLFLIHLNDFRSRQAAGRDRLPAGPQDSVPRLPGSQEALWFHCEECAAQDRGGKKRRLLFIYQHNTDHVIQSEHYPTRSPGENVGNLCF